MYCNPTSEPLVHPLAGPAFGERLADPEAAARPVCLALPRAEPADPPGAKGDDDPGGLDSLEATEATSILPFDGRASIRRRIALLLREEPIVADEASQGLFGTFDEEHPIRLFEYLSLG